ncbi:DUF2061 domain containing membrane protein [Nitzschia inconspicua]|uniref:DUF2061 domain containing membrane protein n=1 Tax=Nitzschia inconspicua TaxID=303405 RepID=A0A9K3LEJ5_9STRA|nr:DUF2061 domain containing membrane protein [Nitzschia inconspicua]
MTTSTFFCRLVLLAALMAATVSSFTTVVPLTTIARSSAKLPKTGGSYSYSHKSDLLRASTAGDPNATISDRIIRQLEKEEAKVTRKRQQAMEKLNEYERSLSNLQTKKQEYLNGGSLASSDKMGGNFSETTLRSAVKAFLWRVVAGSVTFVTSLQFSGSVTTALSIVGSDFFSKAFTMFIGERLMNKSQAGRKSGTDGAGRSLAKALIWRLFAICNTLTMAIFISKDLSVASKIAGSDAIFKTGLMYVYERVWAKIEWGKEYQVEYNL